MKKPGSSSFFASHFTDIKHEIMDSWFSDVFEDPTKFYLFMGLVFFISTAFIIFLAKNVELKPVLT